MAEKLEINSKLFCALVTQMPDVKVTLNSISPVMVYSDDTDILCLLVHYKHIDNNSPNIF